MSISTVKILFIFYSKKLFFIHKNFFKLFSNNSRRNGNKILLVEAIWDHVAMLTDELPFVCGDLITVLDSNSNSGLWYGVCRDNNGWFPASYVQVIIKKKFF